MNDENDPVLPTEYVFRRINNKKDWYNSELEQPVTRVACSPFKKDVDGLSVFRELFVSASDVAAAGPDPAGYYVARLLVADILELGLTVIPAPQEGMPKGHAIIPELTTAAANNAQTRRWAKEIANKLARLAGRSIVALPNP